MIRLISLIAISVLKKLLLLFELKELGRRESTYFLFACYALHIRDFFINFAPANLKNSLMMDILPLHIEYLLTRHDCVIVPGLGAFIATEQEAYIDFERGVVRPRRREVSFNCSVVTDDGLLSHSIARRERISYEDARRLVAVMSERMAADLQNEGEVSIGMTGRLVKDQEGLVSFQPRRSAILSDIKQDVRLASLQAAPESVAPMPEDVAPEEAMDEDDGMRTIRVKADIYLL